MAHHVVRDILVLTAALAIAEPVPFLISGRVSYSNTFPVNNPDVTGD